MILLALLLIPLIGIFIILASGSEVALAGVAYNKTELSSNIGYNQANLSLVNKKHIKVTALTVSIVNLFISLIMFIFFDFSSNQFQFVQEYHEISYFHIYLGVDGLSIYFVLLTTIITPISLLSN